MNSWLLRASTWGASEKGKIDVDDITKEWGIKWCSQKISPKRTKYKLTVNFKPDFLGNWTVPKAIISLADVVPGMVPRIQKMMRFKFLKVSTFLCISWALDIWNLIFADLVTLRKWIEVPWIVSWPSGILWSRRRHLTCTLCSSSALHKCTNAQTQ